MARATILKEQRLYQPLFLLKDDGGELILAPTWTLRNLMTNSIEEAKRDIREATIDLVRSFANDFLKANPKKTNER